MCRAFSGFVYSHPALAGYDYFWRLDSRVRYFWGAEPLITALTLAAVLTTQSHSYTGRELSTASSGPCPTTRAPSPRSARRSKTSPSRTRPWLMEASCALPSTTTVSTSTPVRGKAWRVGIGAGAATDSPQLNRSRLHEQL